MRRSVVLVLLAIAVLLAAGLTTFESAEAPSAKPAPVTEEPAAPSPRASAIDAILEAESPAVREALAESPATPRSGALRVRACAADGRPLAGLAGAIRSESDSGELPRQAATGDDGEFVFADLAPGAVEVRLDELDRRRVWIEAGRESVVEFKFDRALAIDGLVVDASDAPVGGAEVFAIRHADWPVPDRWTRVAITDDQGRFRATCVGGPSPWALRAQHGALRSALVDPGLGDGEFLGDGSARVRIVLMPAEIVVRGTVFRDDGRTATDGSITLLGARVRPRGVVTPGERCIERGAIGDDGNFELRSRRGSDAADLIVTVPGCGTVIVPLVLPADGALYVDPIVREAAVIEGVVRDEMSRGIGGATLRVRGVQRMDDLTETVAREDGSFRLQGVPRGVGLVVIASAPLHESDPEPFAPIESGLVFSDFTLVRQAVIAGKLLRENGSPLAGWRIEIRRNGHPEPRNPATVADDGGFALGTEPGSPVQLFAIARETNLRIPLAGGRLLAPGTEPEQVFVIRDDELPNAHVRGRIVVAEGTAADRFSLQLFDGRTRARNLRRVGADGSFEFGPVPARRYRLLLRDSNGAEQEMAEFALACGQRLELGELRAR